MANSISLELVTPTDAALKANIKELYIPAYMGEAGVLENHLPYISLLQPGEMFYTDTRGNKHYLYVRDGIMEVMDNKIVIISDSVERGDSMQKEKVLR